jgi:hypothetical protein
MSPNTASSAVRLTRITSAGAGAFSIMFNAPTDLGGYPTFSYRVEMLVSNVWTSVASGAGATVNTVNLNTPNRTSYFTYRVIATNPSGESGTAQFSYRG